MNEIKINSIVKTKKSGSGYIYKSYVKDIKIENDKTYYLIASSDKWWGKEEIVLIRA